MYEDWAQKKGDEIMDRDGGRMASHEFDNNNNVYSTRVNQ